MIVYPTFLSRKMKWIICIYCWLHMLPGFPRDGAAAQFQGIDFKQAEMLLTIIEPKTCGCARPDQTCEIPIPQAKYFGVTCRVGQFCCRRKRAPSRAMPSLPELQQLARRRLANSTSIQAGNLTPTLLNISGGRPSNGRPESNQTSGRPGSNQTSANTHNISAVPDHISRPANFTDSLTALDGSHSRIVNTSLNSSTVATRQFDVMQRVKPTRFPPRNGSAKKPEQERSNISLDPAQLATASQRKTSVGIPPLQVKSQSESVHVNPPVPAKHRGHAGRDQLVTSWSTPASMEQRKDTRPHTTYLVSRQQQQAPGKHPAGLVRQVGSAPVRQLGAAPVRQVGSAPVRKVGSAPVRQAGSAPVRQVVSDPIRQMGSAPVRQAASAAVRHVVSDPIRQVGSAAVRPVVSDPIRQVGSAPVRQAGSAPIRQVGSAPVRQTGGVMTGRVRPAGASSPVGPVYRVDGPVVDSPAPLLTLEDLGLPPDVAGYIRPASSWRNRVSYAQIEEDDVLQTDCRCLMGKYCQSHQIDLTFGESCPYGQVRCCITQQVSQSDLIAEAGSNGSVQSTLTDDPFPAFPTSLAASTAKVDLNATAVIIGPAVPSSPAAFPAVSNQAFVKKRLFSPSQLGQVRPVSLPFVIVPITTSTTTTTITTTTTTHTTTTTTIHTPITTTTTTTSIQTTITTNFTTSTTTATTTVPGTVQSILTNSAHRNKTTIDSSPANHNAFSNTDASASQTNPVAPSSSSLSQGSSPAATSTRGFTIHSFPAENEDGGVRLASPEIPVVGHTPPQASRPVSSVLPSGGKFPSSFGPKSDYLSHLGGSQPGTAGGWLARPARLPLHDIRPAHQVNRSPPQTNRLPGQVNRSPAPANRSPDQANRSSGQVNWQPGQPTHTGLIESVGQAAASVASTLFGWSFL